MKKIITYITLIFIISPLSMFADDNRIEMDKRLRPKIEVEDGVWIKMRHGNLYIYDDYEDKTIMKITENYDVFIKGKRISLTQDQQIMIQNFYHTTLEVNQKTKAIAKEGVGIGMKGAGLGLKAVLGVVKLLLPTYDGDDLERDMEAAAAKLEMKADELEEKADSLDIEIDKLQELYDEIEELIPDISEWEWI